MVVSTDDDGSSSAPSSPSLGRVGPVRKAIGVFDAEARRSLLFRRGSSRQARSPVAQGCGGRSPVACRGRNNPAIASLSRVR